MSDFPNVLTQVWKMDSSDLCVVGEHLGYTWNQICDEIRSAGFYASDGAGALNHRKGEETGSKILDEIMNTIYANWTRVKQISIVNDD